MSEAHVDSQRQRQIGRDAIAIIRIKGRETKNLGLRSLDLVL